MKNTRKKFNYRVNKTSKKLKGGAGKLNNKKQKKRPQMTAQDYENQLLKSFPYGFVLHGEVGTKARKTQDVLQREFYEALNEANNTRVNKRSTVSGIPKNEAQSEGLFDAMAKGQQEGLTTYSRMQSAMRRATQPISRMTGVPISEDPRGLMTQAQGLMATGKSRGRVGSRGTSSSVSPRRGSRPIKVTSKSSTTPGIPGMPTMPGMPGATTAQDTGMPPAPPGETGNFMNTGENFPDSEQVVLEEADTSDPDECPCCTRAFTDETKLNEEWINGLTEKIEDAKKNLEEKKQRKANNLKQKKAKELAEKEAEEQREQTDKEEEDKIKQCRTDFTSILSVDGKKLDKLIEEAKKQKEKLEAKAEKKKKKGKKGKKSKKQGNNKGGNSSEETFNQEGNFTENSRRRQEGRQLPAIPPKAE